MPRWPHTELQCHENKQAYIHYPLKGEDLVSFIGVSNFVGELCIIALKDFHLA